MFDDDLKQKTRNKIIAIDLGNFKICCSSEGKKLCFNNDVKINEEKQLTLGANGNIKNIITMLGRLFEDANVQKNLIYSESIVTKAKDDGIEINNIPLTVILALIFKTILKAFNVSGTLAHIIVTIKDSESNAFRIAIKTALYLNSVTDFEFVTIEQALVAQYMLKKEKINDNSIENIGVLDLGDRNSIFSMLKLHYYEQNIIETLESVSVDIGGSTMTKTVVNRVLVKLQKERGMNISNVKALMAKLSEQCTIAKEKKQDIMEIKVSDLPDFEHYIYRLSQYEYEKLIITDIETILKVIELCVKKASKDLKILCVGQAIQTPLFKKLYEEKFAMISSFSNNFDCTSGMEVLPSFTRILVCPFELKLETESLSFILIKKGEEIPTRKHKKMSFPKGEVNFIIKLFQNEVLIDTVLISEIPKEYLFEFIVEIDKNLIINYYGRNEEGLIKIKKSEFGTIDFSEWKKKLETYKCFCYLEN